MAESSTQSGPLQKHIGAFGAHLLTMPRWHKTLLSLAALLFGAGSVGQIAGYFTGSPAAQTTSNVENSSQNTAIEGAPSDARPKAESPTVLQRVSPSAMKVGFGFVAGFVIGWVVRVFLKTTAILAAVGMALLVGLSYFHVFNIDFSSVEKQYSGALSWAADQAQRLGSSLLHHLPSSTAGGAGMFLGFKRK